MIIDTGTRQSGKSTRMLDWMHSSPLGTRRVCVSVSLDQCRRLYELARDRALGLEEWQFVSFEQLLDGRATGLAGRVYLIELGFEDLELVLQRMLLRLFPFDVGRVSMSVEA
ncbi:MAG TPA: hypothetical protein VG265_07300 [Gaiellaceae bacterium]|nr:hypothetical protein [Gaiellaceae bacterium]